VTADELRKDWEARAGEDLVVIRNVIAATNRPSAKLSRMSASEALESAEAHVFERRSVVGARDLLREALVLGRGEVLLADLRTLLAEQVRTGVLWQSGDEIALREGLQSEEEFLGWANNGRNACAPLGRSAPVEGLSAEQQEAVAGLLS